LACWHTPEPPKNRIAVKTPQFTFLCPAGLRRRAQELKMSGLEGACEMASKVTRGNGKKRTNAATIYDVARRVGVSPMTVSRVVNGESNVREATREAVQKAMKELQFRPNKAARSLAGATEIRIGLIYNNPSVAYFTEFLMGALEGSGLNGAQLVVDKSKVGDPAAGVAAVRTLLKGGVNGMVLTAPLSESADLIAELKSLGIAVVGIATGSFTGEVTRVGIDDFRAGYDMTKYLIGQGHRRIGFIKGHPSHSSSRLRFAGFEAAIRDAGAQFAHRLDEEFHGAGGDFRDRLTDRRQGRPQGRGRGVVDADHRDILGDVETFAVRDAHHARGHVVVRRKNRGRKRLARE